MKRVVRTIDRAIKSLYRLDSPFRAENFLLARPIEGASVGSAGLKGALYLQSGKDDLSLGIYLSEGVREKLATLPKGHPSAWPSSTLEAYTVAAEEVSHFHYVLHNAHRGRQVSHLELELQGEIDKFLVTYFTNLEPGRFEDLFARLFEQFRFAEHLSPEQKERYREANRLAKRFIYRESAALKQADLELTLRRLRRFYRLGSSEKISQILA